MRTVGYYPGCSLSGGAVELDMSIRALAGAASVKLREIADWNCCGATAAHSLNHYLAVALPYRVLALSEAQGLRDILAPCAACFSRLKGTNVRLARSADLAGHIKKIVRLPYSGGIRVINISEFANMLLAEGLSGKLKTPLKGLRAAPYYGCLLSRGEGIIEGDDSENPSSMEAAIKASGCEIVQWNFLTECCGGGLSMSKTGAVVELSNAVLSDAKAFGADFIVTGCPMCHSNLDMRQRDINKAGHGPYNLPIIYLSQLLGLAAGLNPKELGLDRHFINTGTVTK